MSKQENKKDESETANFPFGKVVGFHGLKGEIKVRPSTNNPELLLEVDSVQTKETKHCPKQTFQIRTLDFDKKLFFLTLEGYDDRTSVEELMGAEFLTWEDQVADLAEEEFWIKDLIGMKALRQSGEVIGDVVDIVYGGNDLLEIRRPSDPPGKTILVPFVKSIVPSVDMNLRQIVIADIDGLLEAQ